MGLRVGAAAVVGPAPALASIPAAAPAVDPSEVPPPPGRDSIRVAVQRERGTVKTGDEQGVQKGRNLVGCVAVDVETIQGKGSKVELAEDEIGNPDLSLCIVTAVKQWVFPSEISDEIYLPFNLNAS
jgi:hypothetical protein